MNHIKTGSLIFCLILFWSLSVMLSQCFLYGQQAVNQLPSRLPARIYHSLEEATGHSSQPVLLVFFSLVCHVCWDELFEMKEFIEKFSLPMQLVGVSTDEKEELENFAARYSFPYPIIQDKERKLYRRYKVRLEPYRVILVRNETVYRDDDLLDYSLRREKAKQFLFTLSWQ
ncbi:MAG TPA: redoxin domain-containing protein [Candidatus Saccharicenans sp.]|jgi:peroxiredoxin|nr:redoxin domain-containing protein [Candidatus Saccharicenans sp.]HRD03089.1 redoxin domain-containing protein [Candidatus Saccharicenans sp.]